jgi:hypothetical protein
MRATPRPRRRPRPRRPCVALGVRSTHSELLFATRLKSIYTSSGRSPSSFCALDCRCHSLPAPSLVVVLALVLAVAFAVAVALQPRRAHFAVSVEKLRFKHRRRSTPGPPTPPPPAARSYASGSFSLGDENTPLPSQILAPSHPPPPTHPIPHHAKRLRTHRLHRLHRLRQPLRQHVVQWEAASRDNLVHHQRQETCHDGPRAGGGSVHFGSQVGRVAIEFVAIGEIQFKAAEACAASVEEFRPEKQPPAYAISPASA